MSLYIDLLELQKVFKTAYIYVYTCQYRTKGPRAIYIQRKYPKDVSSKNLDNGCYLCFCPDSPRWQNKFLSMASLPPITVPNPIMKSVLSQTSHRWWIELQLIVISDGRMLPSMDNWNFYAYLRKLKFYQIWLESQTCRCILTHASTAMANEKDMLIFEPLLEES